MRDWVRKRELGGANGKAAAMAGGDRERDVEEETRNQMMQNLFGDQSEDEDADDDDDVVEVVDEDDQPQQQQRLHQEDVDDEDDADEEEDDARSHAHSRGSGYHSVNPASPNLVPFSCDSDSSLPCAVSVLVAGLGFRFRDSFVLVGSLVIVDAVGWGKVWNLADLLEFTETVLRCWSSTRFRRIRISVCLIFVQLIQFKQV